MINGLLNTSTLLQTPESAVETSKTHTAGVGEIFTKLHFKMMAFLGEPTRFQVAELGQRPHLQMCQVEGVGLPAGQIPDHMFVHHANTSQLHQCTEQQGDLSKMSSGSLSCALNS